MSKCVKLEDIKDAIMDLNGKVFLRRSTLVPVLKTIVGLPIIDIVNCVECRYKDMIICPMYNMTRAGVLKPYDFCSYGDRREK